MELRQIPIEKIVPNKDNPRGIDIRTQDPKLPLLKDSISVFGVLVPIVVTPKGNKFLLIDGERRYYASIAANREKIPAYVIEGEKGTKLTDEDVLYRMFQIHHLREQWGPIQQCHALEKSYQKVLKDVKIKKIDDAKAAAKAAAIALAEQTGIDERTALDRVKFLRWPKSIKQQLYKNPDGEGYWYICEIEEKIILPSLVNFPEYFEKVSVDEVRECLFSKLGKSLTRSTDVRKVAPYFRAEFKKAADHKKVTSVLDDLIERQEMTYEEAQSELEKQFPNLLQRDPPSPRKVVSLFVNLEAELERFDVESIVSGKPKSKTKPRHLLDAAQSLAESIEQFISRVNEAI